MTNTNRYTSRVSGIIPPMVTPLTDSDTLDVAGLERLIEHILAGGVHGLFILGTTGEGPSLSYRLRRELIERACALVNGRAPVFVGVTDTSFIESTELARHAADHGADAVVVAPPYYFPAGQPELIDYFEHLADALPLPVVIYNMPACTKVNIEPQTLQRLLDHNNVIAYKDSSGQMVYFNQVLRLIRSYPGKHALVGPEEMLAEATLLGGHGGVSGGANLFPRLYVDLYHAASRQDMPAVKRLHTKVMDVSSLIYHIGRHGSSVIKGIKCALSCMGICSDEMAEPFKRFHERERAIVQRCLAELDGHMVASRV